MRLTFGNFFNELRFRFFSENKDDSSYLLLRPCQGNIPKSSRILRKTRPNATKAWKSITINVMKLVLDARAPVAKWGYSPTERRSQTNGISFYRNTWLKLTACLINISLNDSKFLSSYLLILRQLGEFWRALKLMNPHYEQRVKPADQMPIYRKRLLFHGQ